MFNECKENSTAVAVVANTDAPSVVSSLAVIKTLEESVAKARAWTLRGGGKKRAGAQHSRPFSRLSLVS